MNAYLIIAATTAATFTAIGFLFFWIKKNIEKDAAAALIER